MWLAAAVAVTTADAAVLAAAFTAMGVLSKAGFDWLTSKSHRPSGEIRTTTAERLWDEADRMRDERDRMYAALRDELVSKTADMIGLREESVALRKELIEVHAENQRLRQKDLSSVAYADQLEAEIVRLTAQLPPSVSGAAGD